MEIRDGEGEKRIEEIISVEDLKVMVKKLDERIMN